MYFGSADKLNREHLKRLKDPGQADQDPWLSDHLCWAASMAVTPTTCCRCLIRSPRAKVTAQKVREVSDFLEIPIAVENVSSYAEFHVSEMNRVGIPHRGRRAGRLRHSARRE